MGAVSNQYKVITIVGSTQFRKDHEYAHQQLTLEGNIVFTIAPFWRGECRDLGEDVLNMFLNMHLEKILASDEIFVINRNDYIGETTQKEIDFAKEHGKKVLYMFEHNDANEKKTNPETDNNTHEEQAIPPAVPTVVEGFEEWILVDDIQVLSKIPDGTSIKLIYPVNFVRKGEHVGYVYNGSIHFDDDTSMPIGNLVTDISNGVRAYIPKKVKI